MYNDFTIDFINSVFQEELEKFRSEGLSDSEILDRISEFEVEDALMKKIEIGSSEEVDLIESTMYERVLEERTQTTQFVAHNEQIWGKGFVVSEAMYLFTVEAATAYVADVPKEQISDRQFHFTALRAIHGRACQQFLEILFLLKFGFADGAYARWRSLYELSVIAEFIHNAGEDVAKAYCEDTDKEDKHYNWANTFPDFAKQKNVYFSDIKKKCKTYSDIWENQYILSNKIVHASAQGTFGRLANGPGMEPTVPVGHSDFGLAMPAVNSAISLSVISTYFFRTIRSADGLVYIRTIQKWTEILRKYYTEIEAACFGKHDDAEDLMN